MAHKQPTHCDDIYEVLPSLTSYLNNPILNVRSAQCFIWHISLGKAKCYLYHWDKIKHFVSTSGAEAWLTLGKDNNPVLCLEDPDNSYQRRLGLHKCRLLIHWYPYLKMFSETRGKELPKAPPLSTSSTEHIGVQNEQTV